MNITDARKLVKGDAVLVSGRTPATFKSLTRSTQQGLLAIVEVTDGTWYVPVRSIKPALANAVTTKEN